FQSALRTRATRRLRLDPAAGPAMRDPGTCQVPGSRGLGRHGRGVPCRRPGDSGCRSIGRYPKYAANPCRCRRRILPRPRRAEAPAGDRAGDCGRRPVNSPARINASPRDWAGLAVLVLPALLASMDLSVLFMASPSISADLNPTAGQLLWIMDIYGFMMAGLLTTMGNLGDRIGRRRLLIIGASASRVASILSAFASSSEMRIAARALRGLGGATLAPSTLSLILGLFLHETQLRLAIGVWTSAFIGGVSIG